MPEPAEEAIRQRAYQLWEEAGRPDGGDEEHWLEAERRLRAADARTAGPEETSPHRRSPAEATETDPPAPHER